jgi:hypothetical protein
MIFWGFIVVTIELWIELWTEFGIELCVDEIPYFFTIIEILLETESKAFGISGNWIYNFYIGFKWSDSFPIVLSF